MPMARNGVVEQRARLFVITGGGAAKQHPGVPHLDRRFPEAVHCRRPDRAPIPVRVIAYALDGAPDADPTYRLVTSLLEPADAPGPELAALYQERWEIETAFDEFKMHLRGAQRVLRNKTPELVRQEAWGFLLAHFAIRALMHEAALGALPKARDPDTLSFTHAVRVIRRTLPHLAALSPSGPAARASGRRQPTTLRSITIRIVK